MNKMASFILVFSFSTMALGKEFVLGNMPVNDAAADKARSIIQSLQLYGRLVDPDGNNLSLPLDKVIDGDPFVIVKDGRGGGTWFRFLPASPGFYYISVSGKKNGAWRMNRALLYTDPSRSPLVLSDDLTDNKAQILFTQTGENSGEFLLSNTEMAAENYLFEFIEDMKDPEAFTIQNSNGKYLGTSDMAPLMKEIGGRKFHELQPLGVIFFDSWIEDRDRHNFVFKLKGKDKAFYKIRQE